MKKLFTFLFALCATVAISAQDASAWTPQQEITDELTWQNVKYTGDKSGWETAGDAKVGWMYDTSVAQSGSIEMFQNPEGAELYQVIWLPAGYYKFTVQGFYRPTDWGKNFDDEFAQFFCDVVEEQEVEGEDGDINYVYVTKRSTSKPLRHITSDAYESEDRMFIEYNDKGEINWPSDSGWKKDGVQCWVPNSMSGASTYFDKDMYENEMYVVNTEDTYVKIGIRKTGYGGGDWTIFNNFRAFYISDAGEAVQLMLAQDDVAAAEKKAANMQDKLMDEFGALGSLLGDAIFDIQESDEYNSTIAECEATVAKIEAMLVQYNQYYADAKALAALVDGCKAMNEKAQDATLAAAIDNAEKVVIDGTGDNEFTLTSPEAYKEALDALTQARVDYMMTFPSANGAWDFTSMIKNPWFCNDEYNPTWDDELGYYKYNDEIEENWVKGYGEKGVPDIMNEHPDWTNIASDVKWTNKKDATGEWIFNHNITDGWMGGIDNVTMQHGYTAVGAWSADPCVGYQEMRQVITGLPNGYYTMGAYFINAGADPMEYNQYVYITPGSQPDDETMATARFTHKGEHWWWGAGNYPLYRTDDWQDLRTDFVHVSDGSCVIGSRSNGFYAVTGFRLYYYGENPDFTAMVKPEIEAVKAIELSLAGDRAHVDELLATIPEAVTGFDSYKAACAVVSEARDYANAAVAYMASWSANEKFMKLQGNYEEDTDEYKMLDPTWTKTLAYEDEPDATYLGAQAIDRDYETYVKYYGVRAEMLKVGNDELNAILDKQCSALKADYAPTDVLEGYIADLAAPYNAAILASLGGDKATADSPVDITTLVVNPAYDNGKTGWNGEFTVDGNWKNAEVWNTSAFRVSQTIYNLPAGSYRIQVQAFYRDGGDAKTAYENYYAEELAEWYGDDEEEGDEPAEKKSYKANVKLFANGKTTDVASIASEKFGEPSMTERITEWKEDTEATEAYHDEHCEDDDYDPEYKAMYPEYAYIDLDNPGYPFDQFLCDEADTWDDLWYPNSMEGTMNRFKNSPAAYINTIEVSLFETCDLTFGLEKLEGIGADWCMFDNWKLFYISTDPVVSIANVPTAPKAEAIYSVNGIRQQSLSRGINIVRSSDGTVKKVVK